MRIVAECAEAGQLVTFLGGSSITKLSHVRAGVRVACWLFALWTAGFL